MKHTATAINTTEIQLDQGQLPEWLLLLPARAVAGRDGREWRNDAPAEVEADFARLGRDLPIDVEHSSELRAPQGEPAPAVGWITAIEARDGEIWGRAEWNEDGKRLVTNRAYRYHSPVIVYDRASGRIVGVRSVGLTNQPNLRLPALNRETGGTPPNEEDTMTKALLAALALPETATEAEALAKITSLQADLATAANRADNPSLAKFVPRADYDAALARATNAEAAVEAIRKERLEADVEAAIGQALQDGKITPATADYHRAQCRQEGGLARFTEFCKAAPVLGADSGLDGKEPKGTALNSEDGQRIAALFGNSAEDLAKFGK